MTKYCSKKVVIFGLCITTILVSALIGRNLYQGSPTFHNIVGDKALQADNADGYVGGRRIQDNRNRLRFEVLRRGGGLANDGDFVVRGGTAESVWQEGDENDSSDSDVNPRMVGKRVNMGQQNRPRITVDMMPSMGKGHAAGSSKDTEYLGDPGVGWSMAGDPRLPRLLRKLMSKLPANVMKDIAPEFRQFNVRRAKDKSLMAKQWEVVVSALKRHGMEQRLPDVINIGVKKSGTNAVGFFITQHPQIAHSLGNEVHFFDRNYDKGWEYYRVRMGFARKEQLSFEKTPKYFVTPDAPPHMLEGLSKDIKFILSVRDPVQRALSDFRHESELSLRREQKIRLRNSKVGSRSPESEGKRFEELVLDKSGNVNASNVILDTSNYAKHFKNWLKYFPREQFMVIDLETLEKGAFHKLKELEQFLSLRPYFEEQMFYYDNNRHGTCMRGKSRPCPAKSTPGVLPKAKPSDATMKKLYDFYRPFNKEFMQLTGQDFPWAHL